MLDNFSHLAAQLYVELLADDYRPDNGETDDSRPTNEEYVKYLEEISETVQLFKTADEKGIDMRKELELFMSGQDMGGHKRQIHEKTDIDRYLHFEVGFRCGAHFILHYEGIDEDKIIWKDEK